MPGATCTAHSGATKAHDWMVGVLGPLFRTAGHTVRTQHGVTASAGQRRGDVELRSYLQDAAGRRSLVFDLSMTHDRFGAVATCSRTVCCRIPRTSMRLCVLLRSATLTAIGNNTLTIRTFLLSAQARACMASFCVFFFYRPTGRPRRTSLPLECHRNATKLTRFVSSARHSYQSLKSKVELAAAKAAALRINLNVEGCGFYRPTGRPRRTSLPLECHRNATKRTRFVSSARHSISR
jgi:hypothetical protein